MSYVSVFKNIPDFLSQPTGIAAIASIGIHGAIAFILPLMPVESNKPKTVASSKAVGLVELSQAEQQRLPKTSVAPKVALQPQIPLPNINSTLPNNQFPLPPIPSNSSILKPLPRSTSVYPTAALPKRQSFTLSSRNRFNTGRSAYKRYTSTYKPYTSAYKPSYTSRNSGVNYGNSRKLPVVNPAKIPPGIDTNQNSPSNQPGNTATNNQQLVAQVKQVFQPGENYSIAATGGFQKYQPQSPANTVPVPASSSSSSQAITALNSYQNLTQSVRQKYPGIEEKAVIRGVVPADKVALQGRVMGRLVVDTEGKVVDVVFPADNSISPAQKVAIRKYFLKNPPPASKNLASYPFSLSFQNNSNVAVGNKIQPGATPAKNQSLQQKLREIKQNRQTAAVNQPVKLKTPVQVSPSPNDSKKPQATSVNQPVKLKTPVQVSPSPNSSKKQQATSVNQPPVKIKTPVQAAPSQNSGNKLLNQLRQVREERQNKSE
ncbi:MAG: hypothetical protein QNJ36_02990 [Calothrix sp. MO_167.B42]|nr:hypothetical protein [Calothrix sp. MO_167.B42]